MTDPAPDNPDAAAEPPPSDDGLRCPDCNCGHLYVIYTRRRRDKIIRQRECRHCGRRINTIEREVFR